MVQERIPAQPSLWRARFALAGGVIALTLSPLFFRWADAPGIVTSFYRMLITSIILIPLATKDCRFKGVIGWNILLFPMIGGLASALDHAFWSTSLGLTAIANATLLNNVSPLWVAIFSWLILKEKLGNSFWIGLVLVLAGATMVLGNSFYARPTFLLGDLLAFVSSVFYAIFFLATSRGRSILSTSVYLLIMSATAAISLFIVTQIFGYSLLGYSVETNMTFLAAAVVSQFGAYYLITYSLGRLPASVVTPTMVAQPVLTALLAIPLMGENLLLLQSLGGMVTLFGIFFINTSSAR